MSYARISVPLLKERGMPSIRPGTIFLQEWPQEWPKEGISNSEALARVRGGLEFVGWIDLEGPQAEELIGVIKLRGFYMPPEKKEEPAECKEESSVSNRWGFND